MPVFKMTPTIIKNFVSKRATRRYPFEVRPPFESARGAIRNEVEKCTFCSICAMKCPSQCITVDKKIATWSYDPYACVYCGICAEACPSDSLQQDRAFRKPVMVKEDILLKGEIPKEKKKSAVEPGASTPGD
jgi:ech hydrogenase subunit F